MTARFTEVTDQIVLRDMAILPTTADQRAAVRLHAAAAASDAAELRHLLDALGLHDLAEIAAQLRPRRRGPVT